MPGLASLRGRRLRGLGLAVVAAGIVLPLARKKLRLPRAVSAGAAAAAPFGMAVAAKPSARRSVAIYALQMWAFIVIHELPYDDPERLERRTRIAYPIDFDRRILGRSANVSLQEAVGRRGGTTALDYSLTIVHWAWFLQPHMAAAWILWKHPRRFARSAVLICSVFDVGMVVYFLVPTAPPWWAAEHGHLTKVRRVMAEVGRRLWGPMWEPMYKFLGGNPVAAMPSLHFASSVMAAHVLDDIDRRAGALGWMYASTLGFALVYLGEHYVVDLLAGLALVEAARGSERVLAPAFSAISGAVEELERQARA